jgi:hypothetical protein
MIMVQFIQWKLQHLPDNQEAIKKLQWIFYKSSRHPTSPLRVKKELISTWLRIPECRKVGDYVHTHTHRYKLCKLLVSPEYAGPTGNVEGMTSSDCYSNGELC